MSYIYYLNDNEHDSIDELYWFMKSYESLDDLGFYDVDLVDKEYEKKFNVKLHYKDFTHKQNVRPIKAIEFPSKANAMLFFLKWS